MVNVVLRVTAVKAKPAPAAPKPVLEIASSQALMVPRISAPVVSSPPPVLALVPATPKPVEGPPRGVWVHMVKKIVCTGYNISKQDIESESRTPHACLARQVAIYLSHTLIKDKIRRSLPTLGRQFGDRDSTTALHAVNKVREMIASNPEFAARIRKLTEQIQIEAAKPATLIDVNAPGRI